jgi:hypothetical protein
VLLLLLLWVLLLVRLQFVLLLLVRLLKQWRLPAQHQVDL